jgi:putative hemolysin
MIRGIQPFGRLAVLLAVALLAAAVAGCGGGTEPPAGDMTPVMDAGDVPAGVLSAREAVLDFLRQGANECVPPEQAGWTLDDVPNPPEGYDVWRFLSGGCAMTITAAEEPVEAPIYHVALGDGPTGFCWQAVVDDRGQILLTGNAAQSDPTLGNPAQAYCEQQGYTFEVVTLGSGQLCGMCVFDDERACNAWAFFHGACTPENAP